MQLLKKLTTAKRRTVVIAATLALAAASALVPTARTFATDQYSGCTSHPTYSASWGSGRICISAPYFFGGDSVRNVSITVDDTLTDGYCVHVEAKLPLESDGTGGTWRVVRQHSDLQYVSDPSKDPVIQSCGASLTVPIAQHNGTYVEYRVVRGDAHWLTPGIATDGKGVVGNWITIWKG